MECVGTKEQLVGSASTTGGGGRSAKGRRKGPNKSELRKFKTVRLGEGTGLIGHVALITMIIYSTGKKDVRWGGLSFPMNKPKDTLEWLNERDMGIKCVRAVQNN